MTICTDESSVYWVIPVGQKKALIMAILKKATGKRNTQLGERIGKYLKAFTRQNELKKVS